MMNLNVMNNQYLRCEYQSVAFLLKREFFLTLFAHSTCGLATVISKVLKYMVTDYLRLKKLLSAWFTYPGANSNFQDINSQKFGADLKEASYSVLNLAIKSVKELLKVLANGFQEFFTHRISQFELYATEK